MYCYVLSSKKSYLDLYRKHVITLKLISYNAIET